MGASDYIAFLSLTRFTSLFKHMEVLMLQSRVPISSGAWLYLESRSFGPLVCGLVLVLSSSSYILCKTLGK